MKYNSIYLSEQFLKKCVLDFGIEPGGGGDNENCSNYICAKLRSKHKHQCVCGGGGEGVNPLSLAHCKGTNRNSEFVGKVPNYLPSGIRSNQF
jgi:hypothetical protein